MFNVQLFTMLVTVYIDIHHQHSNYLQVTNYYINLMIL